MPEVCPGSLNLGHQTFNRDYLVASGQAQDLLLRVFNVSIFQSRLHCGFQAAQFYKFFESLDLSIETNCGLRTDPVLRVFNVSIFQSRLTVSSGRTQNFSYFLDFNLEVSSETICWLPGKPSRSSTTILSSSSASRSSTSQVTSQQG